MCTLYLVRHGATIPNLQKPPVLQGCGIDSDLSDVGRSEAECVADALAGQPIAAFYSSRLMRARQTAAIIAAPHSETARHPEVRTLDDVHEISAGDWEGRTWPDVMAEDRDRYLEWAGAAGEAAFPGGESYVDVALRSLPPLLDTARRHDRQAIVVVAHRVVNRAVIGQLLGLDCRRWKDIPQDNAAINVLRLKDDRLQVVTLNAVEHLRG